MIRLTVLYGHPTDPAEFDRYYREVHLPLAARMKGLKGWTIGKCEAVVPGEQPPYYLMVGLWAEDRAAMEAILASPEGQAAVADVPKFATGGATFVYDDERVLLDVSLVKDPSTPVI
ncbi:MAG: EthD family reductase [Planctomycetales bacterium]|nr:EthD family reductase [Planctomycetales bacterium]